MSSKKKLIKLGKSLSSKSLVPIRSHNELQSLELMKMPEVPNPIKIFTSPDERSPVKEFHKKRFKYNSKEKIELKQIKY